MLHHLFNQNVIIHIPLDSLEESSDSHTQIPCKAMTLNKTQKSSSSSGDLQKKSIILNIDEALPPGCQVEIEGEIYEIIDSTTYHNLSNNSYLTKCTILFNP